ncbi:nucleotide triphosphate diphosphatase NUDT15 [Gallaecimonas xiamenensis]|uniref:NUDIX hydrolase n=1 Tax=Gallaecimonas xiamenensis 3-C-1 TaxID=745411 RepID=K2JKD6_9GAMM|nr:NUDIX hydrolase [Gallaecimonas xiamenensis 3-C-1]
MIFSGPKVGVGVVVERQGRVLVGQRRGSHGQGHWALPGGHLEAGECPLACAQRELAEETGLQLDEPRLVAVSNDLYPEGLHYLTLFVTGTLGEGEPRCLEPQKCAGWHWFEWDQIPEPRFLSLDNLLHRPLLKPR